MKQLNVHLIDDSEFSMSDSDTKFKVVLHPKESLNLRKDSLPLEMIENLYKTMNLMVSAGLGNNFSDVYIDCRRKCLEESLSRHVEVLTRLVYTNPSIFTWE